MRIGHTIVNQRTERWAIFRVQDIEPFHNLLCVCVPVCEDDGLANPFTTLYLQTILHQVLQNLVYGIYVMDIGENLISGNIPMVIITLQCLSCLFIFPDAFHLLLFFRRKG